METKRPRKEKEKIPYDYRGMHDEWDSNIHEEEEEVWPSVGIAGLFAGVLVSNNRHFGWKFLSENR